MAAEPQTGRIESLLETFDLKTRLDKLLELLSHRIEVLKVSREIDALIKRVAARDTTVVLVEHNMHLVMGVSDHILVLDHGRRLVDDAHARRPFGPSDQVAYRVAVLHPEREDR